MVGISFLRPQQGRRHHQDRDHFLPDVYVPCEVCKGRRYNRETLEVRYKGKNIAEVLQMTVEEGTEFFSATPKIHRPDKPECRQNSTRWRRC